MTRPLSLCFSPGSERYSASRRFTPGPSQPTEHPQKVQFGVRSGVRRHSRGSSGPCTSGSTVVNIVGRRAHRGGSLLSAGGVVLGKSLPSDRSSIVRPGPSSIPARTGVPARAGRDGQCCYAFCELRLHAVRRRQGDAITGLMRCGVAIPRAFVIAVGPSNGNRSGRRTLGYHGP
jgi:hypothetical protein